MIFLKSIWSESVNFEAYPTLKEDINIDTIVIGAGMAGILTAYSLLEKGIEAAVINSKTICSGQTKNTTAKITGQHGAIYHKISKYYGAPAAKQYALANESAIEAFERIIHENEIECDFKRKKAVLYSLKNDNTLQNELHAAKTAGINCILTKSTELPFPVSDALVFENQAQFNPLQFIAGIAKKLKIYENTPAIKLIGNTVYTPEANIKAKNIVVACNYPFINFPAMYFLRMSRERSYVIAADCGGYELNGMYIGTDKGSLSLRNYNNLVLLGGGAHRTGKNDREYAYKMISRSGERIFSSFREVARWSAQDCITLDGIPYIGRFSKEAPNIYVATGFGKWGMTSSMAAANIITDMICKKDNPYSEIFSPQRFNFPASAKHLFTNLGETVKGFASHIKITRDTEDDVPINTAKEIKYNGHNAGAYRDSSGKIYIVSLKCPHLKCKLNWNETTKTWDCPCHGSRYDYRGNLIDNPAQHESIRLNKSDDY